MKALALAAFLAAYPATAQQPEKEIDLHVTRAEAQLVLNALTLLPWKDVNPLIVKLSDQLKTQLAPRAPEAAPQ